MLQSVHELEPLMRDHECEQHDCQEAGGVTSEDRDWRVLQHVAANAGAERQDSLPIRPPIGTRCSRGLAEKAIRPSWRARIGDV